MDLDAHPSRTVPASGVAATVGVGLSVAIWAEQAEVLQAIVTTVPVDVIELQCQGPPVPGADSALFTARIQQAGLDQASLEVACRSIGGVTHEDFLEGSPMCRPVGGRPSGPPLPQESVSIEAEVSESAFERSTAPLGVRVETEPAHHVRDRPGHLERGTNLAVRPCRLEATRPRWPMNHRLGIGVPMGDIQTQAADVLLHRHPGSTSDPKTEPTEDPVQTGRLRHRRRQLLIGPRTTVGGGGQHPHVGHIDPQLLRPTPQSGPCGSAARQPESIADLLPTERSANSLAELIISPASRHGSPPSLTPSIVAAACDI